MDTHELHTIAGAAAAAGISRTTLSTAVHRGDVPCEMTADGLRLVRLEDVLEFVAHPPRRGPAPKAQGASHAR